MNYNISCKRLLYLDDNFSLFLFSLMPEIQFKTSILTAFYERYLAFTEKWNKLFNYKVSGYKHLPISCVKKKKKSVKCSQFALETVLLHRQILLIRKSLNVH